MADNGNNQGFWPSLFSALDDFGTWFNKNFSAANTEDVSTEELLRMQKEQQRALLIVMGLSLIAVTFTVFWTGESPFEEQV